MDTKSYLNILNKKENINEEDRNKLIEFLNVLSKIDSEFNQNKTLNELYIYFSENKKELLDFNRIKNSNHKNFYQILIDLYSQFGKEGNIIKNLIKLLLEIDNFNKEKIYYIFRNISIIIQNKDINFEKLNNLISIIVYLFTIKENTNLFLLGGPYFFLPIFEVFYNNYPQIKNHLKDINTHLIQILRIFATSEENKTIGINSNVLPLISLFLTEDLLPFFYGLIKKLFNERKNNFVNNPLLIKCILLNLSNIIVLPNEDQKEYINLIKNEEKILNDNFYYILIQLSELKFGLDCPITILIQYLYENKLTLENKIYFIQLLNEGNTDLKVYFNLIDFFNIENLSNNNENLIIEYVNNFISLLFNNILQFEHNFKKDMLSNIFKKLLKNLYLKIKCFQINLNFKIEIIKRIIDPTLDNLSDLDSEKSFKALKNEIELIIYIFQLKYNNVNINNFKSRRTNELKIELKSLGKQKKFELEKEKLLFIELMLCSYLKEKTFHTENEGIFEICKELYSNKSMNSNIHFNLISSIFEFIKISQIPTHYSLLFYHILFKILINKELKKEIKDDLNEIRINSQSDGNLEDFENIISKIYNLKFNDEFEIDIFKNDYKYNKRYKKYENLKEIYTDLKISKLEQKIFTKYDNNESNIIQSKTINLKHFFSYNEFIEDYFSKVSINYFKEILFGKKEKKDEYLHLYFQFFEVSKIITSYINIKNLLIDDIEKIKNFFQKFFLIHLQFISVNILSSTNEESKNFFCSIFIFLIEYINVGEKNKNIKNPFLCYIMGKLNIKLPIEDYDEMEEICKKILFFQDGQKNLDYNLDKSKLNILCHKVFEDPFYIDLINIKKIYKDIKKNLFSFNGAYSNLEIFYDKKDKLIYKELNHLTKEYTKPLLIPILDYNSYVPNNDDEFIGKKIFKEKNKNFYQIDLKFNCKENRILFFDNNFYGYNVCFIKPIVYYQGKIQLFNNHLIFYNFQFVNEEKIKEPIYKGSFLKTKKKKYFYINYSDIKFIMKKYYLYEYQGIEIYTETKSYIFDFQEEKIRDIFLKQFLIKNKNFVPMTNNLKNVEIIGYYNKEYEELKDYKDYESLVKLWKKNLISTLHFLMLTNIFANRSLNDLFQYPVFPWILVNYDSSINNEEITIESLLKKQQRNLSLPIAMIELDKLENSKTRKKKFIENYNCFFQESKMFKLISDDILPIYDYNSENLLLDPKVNLSDIPYYYSCHFSNPAYISHYLVRIFPYTLSHISIQGKEFDTADRLFINIDRSFKNCLTGSSDLREIIPQFFYLPQMCININQLNLGCLQIPNKIEGTSYGIFIQHLNLKYGDEVQVNNVLLPYWSKNNNYLFISFHREMLENKLLKIEDWCNLIFGYYSRGKEAQKKGNLYIYYNYWESINVRKYILQKNNSYKNHKDLAQLGLNPCKIIQNKIKRKNINYQSFRDLMENKITIPQSNFEIKNGVEHNSIKKMHEYILSNKILDKSAITYIEVDKVNNYIICGTMNGSIIIFKLKEVLTFYKAINDNDKKINFIHCHSLMNMFITCSEDHFIHVYILPKVKLVSSVYLKEYIPIYSFLSLIPVPCFIVFSKDLIILYSLNGDVICEKKKDKIKVEPCIKVDSYFNEYLLINNQLSKIFFFENNNI